MTNYNPFSLEGKTILVTGASSGIGQATAIECSRMGATVIITGRNEVRLRQTFAQLDGTNMEHKLIVADLTTEDGLESIVAGVSSLDGVALCAGVPNTLPMQFSSRKKFDKIFEINFFSPVELLRLLYKKKILVKGASAVLMASIGGLYRTTFGNGIYGASKSALNTVMKYCAREFGFARQIRVNCVCPGMTETPLIHRGSITDAQLEEDKKRNPLQRYGEPKDMAMAAVYLLSDAASYVNGLDLVVDGGATA